MQNKTNAAFKARPKQKYALSYMTFIFGLSLIAGTGESIAAEALSEDEKALLQLYGDQEMISIATGTKQPVGKAPAVASVITAEDIKSMGATDLDEVLETVPGLHVATSTMSYGPVYTIR